MKIAFFLTFLFLSVIRTCYSQGLLGSFVDFFNVNAPVDSLNSSADGFPDFPPDPDFPPSSGPGLDPGAGPDTGSWADVGLPPDTGFPGDPPANVNTDIAVSGTASQNVPIDAGIPSGTESTLTTNQKTVIGQSQPADLGPTVGQISPVDKTLSAPSSTNIGDSTNPIDPIIPGLPGPLDPGLDGLPPQSGSLTPVDITAGGLPTQPESLTPIDVNAGGLLAQATEVGANLPPFVIDSGDQQGGASQGSTGPTRLDFHFLPKLPDGGKFVNLITGQTNTFRPSLGWIGDPGRPADISVEGPGSSGPLVDSAPVDTGNSNPDPPLSTSIIDVPADANLPPSNLPPEPPVTQPAAPATPIETNPSVEHKGPFFVDPLAAFFDAAPADNQGPTQPDTTSLTDSSISGGNQDVITGNQGGAISGSSVPETISPSGNQAGIFTLFDNQGPTQPDTTSFTDNSILGGNSDVITGNQGGAVSSSSIPETISPSVNQAGIFTLFDLNEASSASQSLANNKPAVLPFETPGMVIPVETNVVQQKERVPDSWVQLYPEGREPRRRVMGFASQSAPQETIEVSAADRILADLSLGSFGRNRDLQRQLRKKRKQQRKQKRLQRQQGRQRQQELQSQRQQPARRQSARQQTRGRNPRRGRLNRQRQTARLTMPSGGF